MPNIFKIARAITRTEIILENSKFHKIGMVSFQFNFLKSLWACRIPSRHFKDVCTLPEKSLNPSEFQYFANWNSHGTSSSILLMQGAKLHFLSSIS